MSRSASTSRSFRAYCGWWLIGIATWLALDDTIALPELIAGVIAAAFGAIAAVTVRRRRRSELDTDGSPEGRALSIGELRHVWRLPVGMVGDLLPLATALFDAVRGSQTTSGRLRTVSFTPPDAMLEGSARVAVAAYAGSVAPGTIVVALDCTRNLMLIHELIPGTGRRNADPLELG